MAEIPSTQRQNNTAANSGANTASPPNISAQPQSGSKNAINGLMAFLNEYQRGLVKKKIYDVADQYEIEFAPASLASSSITKGSDNVDKSKTPLQNASSASSRDPAKQSTNSKIRTYSAAAGMPIVQFIDQVLRNSTYITNQANWAVPDDPPEEDVQSATPVKDPANAVPLKWFKISVVATSLGYDEKRQDDAYKMKFVVSEFPVNQCSSEYFPPAALRGAHKAYRYWFTGENTEILDYEQEFNHAYTTILSNPEVPVKPVQAQTNNREVRAKSARPTNDQSTQGADRNTNAIGASFADSLYSIGDLGQVKMRILGDPAWIMQGEISAGVFYKNTFDFKPFLPDGTINFDAGEVAFKVVWNRPQDYNLATGLMEVQQSNRPQDEFYYKAKTCKNIFKDGKFYQELEGVLITAATPTGAATALVDRPGAAKSKVASNTGTRPPSVILNNAGVRTSSLLTPQPWSAGPLGTGVATILPASDEDPYNVLRSSPAYISAKATGASEEAALAAANSALTGRGTTGSIVRRSKQTMAKDQ